VIGGLLMSTVATLLVLPAIFSLAIGRRTARSPSVYPDDPESPHYDPLVFAEEPGAMEVPATPQGADGRAADGEPTPPSTRDVPLQPGAS
jgi:hypothetical protein